MVGRIIGFIIWTLCRCFIIGFAEQAVKYEPYKPIDIDEVADKIISPFSEKCC